MFPVSPSFGRLARKFRAARFIAASTLVNPTGDATLDLAKPAGVVEGDLLIAFLFSAGGSAVAINTSPSGWTNEHTSLNTLMDGGNSFHWTEFKVAGNSEPASYQWILNGGGNAELAGMLAYRPASPSQLDSLGSAFIGSNTSHSTAAVTTTKLQSRVVSAMQFNKTGAGGFVISSPPTGMTNRIDIDGTAVTRDDLRMVVFEEDVVLRHPQTLAAKPMTLSANAFSYSMTAAIAARGA